MRQAVFILGSAIEVTKAVKDRVAFEITSRLYIVALSEIFTVGLAQNFDQFVVRPDVEFALLAFRVGVKRGEKSAVVARHLAAQPCDGFARALCEQGIFAMLPGK